MNINQAFEILSGVGGAHVARIITENCGSMSRISVWRVARALRRGVPVAKIIHKKWFFGIPFYTNRHTLDPRPDTETLVESVLNDWRSAKNVRILDLGTGTGCIAISIIMNIHGASGVGVDVSRRALRVARKNARTMGLCSNFAVLHGTFMRPNTNGEQFDVIVSNPPYIPSNDIENLDEEVKNYDPIIALDGGKTGLDFYEKIIIDAPQKLSKNGMIFFEVGINQAKDVKNLLQKNFKDIRIVKDYNKIDRVVYATIKN